MKRHNLMGRVFGVTLALVLVGGLPSLILPSSALGKNQTSYPVGKPSTSYVPSEILYFNREADFSDVQGYRYWYYMYNFDIPMNYGTSYWGLIGWHDPEGCCIIDANMMHPGCGGCDAEIPTLKWVSPASGKARIYGNARKLDIRGGWGVTVGIYHNYSMLWSQYIAYDDDIGYDFDMSLHVEEGDAVYFTVDANCDNNFDTTSFNPIIILNTMPLAAGTECLETSTGTGVACFTTSSGNIEDLEALPAIPPGAPAGVTFPHGLFSFKVTGLSSGQQITITIELPDPVPVGAKWWKYEDSLWDWVDINSQNGNVITITLQDDGDGDFDDIPGQITDPGGPGYAGAVGWETYPTDKTCVLLPWISLLSTVVAGASLFVLRHRRRSPKHM